MFLITAARLLDRLDAPDLRIADVRWWLTDREKGRRDYDASHIPGAVFVDLDRDLSAPEGPGRHPLPDAVTFLARMEELGFGREHEIVVYDDAGGTVAARLWWMLDNLGHPRVRLLDGGLPAWIAAGGPVTAEAPNHPPAELHLADRWRGTIDRDALAAGAGRLTVLDARARERYRGDVEPVDPVAGHIPGARSAPATATLGTEGRFLPPDALRDHLAQIEEGALGRTVVASCGSGVTACHTILAHRVAGLPDPLLYPGSYSDWSRSGMPVATGDEPGGLSPTP
jgi:thiosulfate/3-mercaptopyruvate sulfurtransferase